MKEQETSMRILVAVVLLGVGFVAGAASWAGWSGTAVQAQAIPPPLDTRFVIGPMESVGTGKEQWSIPIRLMRDKRTSECFLVSTEGSRAISTIVKVEAGACTF
jgi:hypothetical protein